MLMLRFTLAAAAALALAATPGLGAPCKDTKGKFIKCPPSNIVKGKDGKCRVATGPNKGKFTKCG
jgi:hypothetical protein